MSGDNCEGEIKMQPEALQRAIRTTINGIINVPTNDFVADVEEYFLGLRAPLHLAKKFAAEIARIRERHE